MAIFSEVKFDGLKSREWIVYRHPCEQLALGTLLLVREGQAALFVRDGIIADVFGPGKYILSTENIPMLQEIAGIGSDRTASFQAEVYYLNTLTKLDIFWGTATPIQLIDPQYGIKLRVRAFGQAGIRLKDCRAFYSELIGAMPRQDAVNYEKIYDYCQGLVVSRVKVMIAEKIIQDKISALEITLKLEEISDNTWDRISREFEKYGLEITNFIVQSINFPDEDFRRVNQILEQNAEFNILGDARYTAKRSFDVYEGAANNQSGAAAGVLLSSGSTIKPMSELTDLDICPHCGEKSVAGSRFCSFCGMPMAPQKLICPKCGNEMPEGSKFCNECGTPLQAAQQDMSDPISPGQASSPRMAPGRDGRNLFE